MDVYKAIEMAEKEALISEQLAGHVSQDWPNALRILVKETKKSIGEEK